MASTLYVSYILMTVTKYYKRTSLRREELVCLTVLEGNCISRWYNNKTGRKGMEGDAGAE